MKISSEEKGSVLPDVRGAPDEGIVALRSSKGLVFRGSHMENVRAIGSIEPSDGAIGLWVEMEPVLLDSSFFMPFLFGQMVYIDLIL